MRKAHWSSIDVARTRGSGAVADNQITGMLGKTTRDKRPALIDQVHRMLESAPVDGIVGALEAMMGRIDSTATLATIDVPTLVLVGQEDVLTPVAEAELLHEAIRGSRLRGDRTRRPREQPRAAGGVQSRAERVSGVAGLRVDEERAIASVAREAFRS